jgi:hypothetical protein
MANVIILKAKRGDTNQFDVTVTRNGVVFNITGCTLWFTAKYQDSDPDPGVCQVSTSGPNAAGSIIMTDPVTGKAQITLNPAATSSLINSNQLLTYDLQLKDGTGKVSTVTEGTLLVSADVTLTTA